MPRVMLTVSEDERHALINLARDERRDPRAQAAIELRRALERAGYLPIEGIAADGAPPWLAARQQPAGAPAQGTEG